jgi:phosphatidylserine/phosphatidylglycerophosphate/cardiolipin synthase-like enzyme
MDESTKDQLDSLVDIVRKMIDNILSALWLLTWIPFLKGKINKALHMLGKAEIIKYLAETTVPSISWNHAKILAVHGKTLMTGGVNFWQEYADNEHHINDMSVKIRGDAAISAHRYCDYFWG